MIISPDARIVVVTPPACVRITWVAVPFTIAVAVAAPPSSTPTSSPTVPAAVPIFPREAAIDVPAPWASIATKTASRVPPA